MRTTVQRLRGLCFVAVLGLGVPVFAAQAPANARPKDATGACKDGTYTTATTKRGACAGHGGVATWFADTKAAAKATKDAAKSTGGSAKATGKSAAHAGESAGSAAAEGAKAVGSAGKNAGKEVGGAAKSVAKAIAKPSDAPANATAKCKDGTYSEAKQHRGACSGHGGVADWYR